MTARSCAFAMLLSLHLVASFAGMNFMRTSDNLWLHAQGAKHTALCPCRVSEMHAAWPLCIGAVVKTTAGAHAIKRNPDSIPLFERIEHAAATASLGAARGAELFAGYVAAQDKDGDGYLSGADLHSLCMSLVPSSTMVEQAWFEVCQRLVLQTLGVPDNIASASSRQTL